MKTKPKNLLMLAAFFLILAASFPMQVMALYGHPPWEVAAIASKLAPLNWAIMMLAPVTAGLAFFASPWLMVAIPALTMLVFYNNWLVAAMGSDFNAGSTVLSSLGFVVAILFLLNREGLKAVLNPSSRWWRTPFRKRMALPVRFKLLTRHRAPRKGQDGYDEFYVHLYDLSEGGAFIPMQQAEVAGKNDPRNLQIFGTILKTLAVGTQCYVCLPLKDVNFIQCRAEIVRNTPGRGEYPAGVGIRFLGLSRAERRQLASFLASPGISTPGVESLSRAG